MPHAFGHRNRPHWRGWSKTRSAKIAQPDGGEPDTPAAKTGKKSPDKSAVTNFETDEALLEKKTAQANVAKQFEDLKAKFDLSPDQLDKLKTHDAPVAASNEVDTPQAAARISGGGPKV